MQKVYYKEDAEEGYVSIGVGSRLFELRGSSLDSTHGHFGIPIKCKIGDDLQLLCDVDTPLGFMTSLTVQGCTHGRKTVHMASRDDSYQAGLYLAGSHCTICFANSTQA